MPGRLDARWDNFSHRGFTWDHFWTDQPVHEFVALAAIKGERDGSFTADAVILAPIFEDAFTRTETRWLGGRWAWHPRDSLAPRDEATAYVDGSHAVIAAGQYETYSGYPLPMTGAASFDFKVPAATSSTTPMYGLLLEPFEYWGLYVAAKDATDWTIGQYDYSRPHAVFTPVAGEWYRAYFVWNGGTVRAKVWKIGDPEPSGWAYESAQSFDLTIERYPPLLDVYYSPDAEEGFLDNVRVWSSQSSWVGYSAFTADAVLFQHDFTADAVIATTIYVAPSSLGSVDTFTDTDGILLQDHQPDLGPRWKIDSYYHPAPRTAIQSNKLLYKSAAYQVQVNQVDADISIDWTPSADNKRVTLWARLSGLVYGTDTAVIANFGFDTTPGQSGAGVSEGSISSAGYSPSYTMSLGSTYTLRFTLSGNQARLYVDGGLVNSYTVTGTYAGRSYGISGDADDLFDNWSAPYYDPGTTFAADAYLVNTYAGSVEAEAWLVNTIASSWTADAVIQATVSDRLHGNVVPTIVANGTATKSWSAANSISIPKPTGTAAGDLMVAFLSGDGQLTERSIVPEAGWTTVSSIHGVFGGGNDVNYNVILAKVATSGDVAQSSFAFAWNTTFGGALAGGILTIRNAEPVVAAFPNIVNARSSSIPTGTFGPIEKNSLVGGAYVGGGSSTTSFTPDAALTELFDIWVQYTSLEVSSALITSAQVTVGPYTATYSSTISTIVHGWVVKGLATGIWSDAVVLGSREGSFVAEALISPRHFMADAVIWAAIEGSLTADSISRWTQSGTFGADANINPRFLSDAVIKAEITGSFSAKAWIFDPVNTKEVEIVVDGVDITDDVEIASATFTQNVNGAPGQFSMVVKDLNHTYSFTGGQEVTVSVNGWRRFGGYVMTASRRFYFPVDDTTDTDETERAWELTGVDYNILFQRRVTYKKSQPTATVWKKWPIGSSDVDVIRDVFYNYTTLSDDGADMDGVTHVGTPMYEFAGQAGSVGYTFGDTMAAINSTIGAVWYFDQFKSLNWADVDVLDASKTLSDTPGAGAVGYRDFKYTRDATSMINDEIAWGAAMGMDNMKVSRVEDATSIATHGRWQSGEMLTDMWKYISRRANRVVYGTPQSKRGAKDDKESWELAIFDDSFAVGQKVHIYNNEFEYDDVVPIRRMTMTFPTPHSRKYELTLSHEIDTPWKWHESYFPKIKATPIAVKPKPPVFPPPDPGGCGEAVCGITDTFTRTVSGGWGTSDAGFQWGVDDNGGRVFGYGDPADLSVDGSIGIIGCNSPSSYWPDRIMNEVFLYSDYRDRTATVEEYVFSFKLDRLLPYSATEYHSSQIYFQWASPDGWGDGQGIDWQEWDFVHTNNRYGEGTYIQFFDSWDARVPVSVSAGTWYSIRCHQNFATGEAKMRFWASSQAEPSDWDLTGSFPMPRGGVRAVLLGVNHSGSLSDPQVFSFDDFRFDGFDLCSAVEFDSFNRSVTGTWGMSDYGIPWSPANASLSTTGMYAQRVIPVSSGTLGNLSIYATAGVGVVAPWNRGSVFTLRSAWKTSHVHGVGPAYSSIGYEIWRDAGLDGSTRFGFQIGGGSGGNVYARGSGGDEFYLSKNDWLADTWYEVKAEFALGNYMRFKLWLQGQPEPETWTGVVTDTGSLATDAVQSQVIIPIYGGYCSDTQTYFIDYIDFDYDGKGCTPSSIGSTAVFDSFDDRTELYTWGTASSGALWTGTGPGGSTKIAVEDGYGKMEQGTGVTGGQTHKETTGRSDLWGARAYTLTSRFKIESFSASSPATMSWFTYGAPDWENTGWAIRMEYPTSPSHAVVLFGNSLTNVMAAKSFTAGQFYLAKYERDGSTHRVKVWQDGTAEPGWDLEQTNGVPDELQTKLYVYQTRESSSSLDLKIWWDYMSIDLPASTAQIPPATGIDYPTSGMVTESFTATGGQTVFQLQARFVDGTVTMFVEGIFQRPFIDYTTSPSTGQITLDGWSASAGDDVVISYYADGVI